MQESPRANQRGKKVFDKRYRHENCRPLFDNKSVLNNLKNFGSDFDSAHAATSGNWRRRTSDRQKIKSGIGQNKI